MTFTAYLGRGEIEGNGRSLEKHSDSKMKSDPKTTWNSPQTQHGELASQKGPGEWPAPSAVGHRQHAVSDGALATIDLDFTYVGQDADEVIGHPGHYGSEQDGGLHQHPPDDKFDNNMRTRIQACSLQQSTQAHKLKWA